MAAVESSPDYDAGYRHGVADVSARLIGAVLIHLGTDDPDHPLVRRMVEIVGETTDARVIPPGATDDA